MATEIQYQTLHKAAIATIEQMMDFGHKRFNYIAIQRDGSGSFLARYAVKAFKAKGIKTMYEIKSHREKFQHTPLLCVCDTLESEESFEILPDLTRVTYASLLMCENMCQTSWGTRRDYFVGGSMYRDDIDFKWNIFEK